MAIRTLPCLYLPYFLLLFSNFQDGGVLNYAWAWSCMPGTMLGCCGKFLQWTRTRQQRASIAIFLSRSVSCVRRPQFPQRSTRISMHILRATKHISLYDAIPHRPFTPSRTVARVVKCFAENVWGYDVNAADVGLFPMATQQPDATRMCSGGHNSSKKEHRCQELLDTHAQF